MSDFLDEIKRRLEKAFQTQEIEIIDFSAEHAGHVHGPQAGVHATHVEIRINSPRFNGVNRVQRERLVHEVLQNEMQSGRIHALVLKLDSKNTSSP